MGQTFISGTNPDSGDITQIHSYRAEIYGVLSVLTFIQEYSRYYMLPFLSDVAYYCNNLEVVHKVNTLANNPNSSNEQHKTFAVLQLKLSLPPNIIAFHVKGHQDKWKKWENLTILERLNIQADVLIGDNAKAPLNKHILRTSIAIYVKGNYIPNNYVHDIRSACGETDAKAFLMRKYHWNKATIIDIEWEFHTQYIKNQT